MYQNYIFDFYGTLVDIKTDEDSDALWWQLAYFMGYQGAVYRGDDLRKAYDKYLEKYMGRIKGTDWPDVDISDVFYKLYKDAGVKASPQLIRQTARAFRAMCTSKIEVYDSVIDTLEALKKGGKRIFLLSNAQRTFIKPEMKMLGLKPYFEKVYISSDMNMSKPEPKVLERVLTENKLKKKETVFIGNDYSSDIKIANKLGVDSLYIHTATSNNKVKKEKSTYEIMDGNHKEILKLLS